MPRRPLVVAAVLVAPIAVALGLWALVDQLRSQGDKTPGLLVDEVAGTYRGVAIGASRATVVGRVGQAPRWTGSDPIGPLEDDFMELGFPNYIPTPGEPDSVRYDHAAFLLDDGAVTVIIAADERAYTRRGVRIGNALDSVTKRYADFSCDEFRGEADAFPYCKGRVGSGYYLWFGQDPIRSITIASVPLG